MNYAREIISRFGGSTRMAEALGHKHSSTIHMWKASGRIPKWRIYEIQAAAKRLKIKLPELESIND